MARISASMASTTGPPGLPVPTMKPTRPDVMAGFKAADPSASFTSYLRLGIHHILTGYDHLLFLAALALAAVRLADFFKLIATFTVAHSLTVTLSALGYVRLPPWFVEPFIAASIVWSWATLWSACPSGAPSGPTAPSSANDRPPASTAPDRSRSPRAGSTSSWPRSGNTSDPTRSKRRPTAQAGSCCEMQWKDPRPQISSVESTPMTRRSGNSRCRISSAAASLASRYVGTSTMPFAM